MIFVCLVIFLELTKIFEITNQYNRRNDFQVFF